jgi:hypothetical protein
MAMNDDDPYRAPSAQPTRRAGGKGGRRKFLRDVAFAQKGILVCILIEILLFVSQFFVQPSARPIVGVVYVAVSLAATVFVFLLAMKVYNVVLGIVLGIGTIIPCLGLIILLVVNGKATKILQENGISVGLLGADLSALRSD